MKAASATGWLNRITTAVVSLVLLTGVTTMSSAQAVQTVDPNSVIDADLNRPAATAGPASPQTDTAINADLAPVTPNSNEPQADAAPAPTPDPNASQAGGTYRRDDLIGAAEGVFGRGAEGLAGVIEDILRKQGEPNGYIVGREAGGALVFGLRYGSGTLHHKIEGEMPVYWTGPSLGIDVGANAASTFVLVYNLHDTDDLFHRYGAGEGAAYLVGGFNVSYLRRDDVVLIPVRLGVGARLGLNVGYMKFSHRQRWLPF